MAADNEKRLDEDLQPQQDQQIPPADPAQEAEDLVAEAEAVVEAAAAAATKEVEAQVEDASEAQDAPAADADAEGALDAEALAALAAEALENAQAEVAEWKDKYLRLHAEWDTYRRRTTEQRAEEKARATEKLVGDIIPVLDDFERSITYAEENGEEGLLDGVRAVYTKLVETLKKDGVEVIDPAGEAYDALEAQVVAMVEDTSVPDETVAQVFQKGYKMGIKVLRPAMVTVATGGPARPKETPEEEE
ncbi:MAG: nucleotide exchange factor GrpE [Coriobacteriia bacterium]|nr:nucleotide exchange factor GrpE [Coriobacteriia bacterium]